MPTTDQILTDAWTRVESYLPTLDQMQVDYFATHGKYAQGLLSHSARPQDGNLVAPDRLAGSPTDQVETWKDLVDTSQLPSEWMSGLGIDVHETPQGWEYTVRSEIIVSGVTYRKQRRMHADGTTSIVDWQEVA